MGVRDYFGDATPQDGSYDAGADERSSTRSSTNSHATPAPHQSVTPLARIADIWTTDAAGTPKPTFANNAPVFYKIKVVDELGAPVAGTTVTTRVYAPTWDWLTTSTLSAVTDANGVASFTAQTSGSDGTCTIVPLDVRPNGTRYYDSALDTDYRQAFAVQ
jgi:hypothetical protein